MQKYLRRIFAGVLLFFVFVEVTQGQAIGREGFIAKKDGMPGEQWYEETIAIGLDVRLRATIDVTVRRNGTLQVGNLKLRVLDEYNDGALYVGGMLHVEFKDLTGDGFKDLIVTGTVVNTGDKETDPVSYTTVTAIYIFDADKMAFRQAFQLGPKLDSL